jgi:hypothetical protein
MNTSPAFISALSAVVARELLPAAGAA